MQNIEKEIDSFDFKIIRFMKKYSLSMARWAIFIVYFWFGILKVLSLSPANPLVAALLGRVLPGVPFATFIVLLGVYEMIVAIVFVIKGMERLAIFLLVLHLIMVLAPLFLVPAVTWQSFMVPTLEGQYIIKNVLIVAAAMGIAAHLHPMKPKN